MAGEAETRLQGLGVGEADLSLPGLLRNVSFASAGDDSFRSSSASASDVSFRSSVTSSAHMEFDDDDGMYRRMQSEYEEIPSFRWIASPLRWWRTRRTSHSFAGDVSFRSSVASSAHMEFGDGDVTYPWMQSEDGEIPSFRWIASPLPWWRTSRGEDKRKDGTPLRFSSIATTSVKVLGKGAYGTSYKARLKDGSQVALKRLRGAIAREFEAEVNLLGKIRHPNLLAFRAYFLSQDCKLLVFDYMPKGSLSAFLHARDPDNPVDWRTRMKIAIGITWGLHHLHTQEKMAHGNLTSRNVLLDDDASAKIADYGLYRLMTTAANSTTTTAAGTGAFLYRAPELDEFKEVNTKSDVYSLGVILLELLTGKSPWGAMGGLDFLQWVTSIMKEGRSLEVFDEELRERRAEDLFYALNVALHCVNPSPDGRPEVVQVLHQLSEINANLAIEKTSLIVFKQ